MNIMIAGILLLACVLVQHCASYPPPKLPWGPSSFSGISAEASERRLTAPPGDCFLVPYEYDNGNVIHSTLFCSRGVVSSESNYAGIAGAAAFISSTYAQLHCTDLFIYSRY